MLARSAIAAVLGAMIASAKATIDFTPIPGERVLEGIKFPELYFHENGQKISYEQPRGWTYTGDSSRIRFMPPGIAQAFGEMAQAPLAAPQNFDEPTMKLLRERALQSVPSDSHDVTVVAAEKNPLMISGHETYEVTMGYQLYGEQYR